LNSGVTRKIAALSIRLGSQIELREDVCQLGRYASKKSILESAHKDI